MRRGQAVALYPETRGILLEEDHSSYLLVCKLKIMNSSHLKQKKRSERKKSCCTWVLTPCHWEGPGFSVPFGSLPHPSSVSCPEYLLVLSKIATESPGTHLTDTVDGRKEGSCSVVSDSLRPHGLYSPWNSPRQNTGVGSLSLLQGIFPTQGLNLGLPHFRQVLYQLIHLYLYWL